MDSSTHSLSFSITTPVDSRHTDMGAALSAVRNGRKRRADAHHDDVGSPNNRHSKRMREEPLSPGRMSEAPESADTTLVDDTDDHHHHHHQDLKGKARDTFSSSAVSTILPPHDVPTPHDDRGARLVDEIESELRCGCCTELAYNVIIYHLLKFPPTNLFLACLFESMPPLFLWVMYDSPFVTLPQRSELHPGHLSSMPHLSTGIAPSRVVQSLVAALLRVYPERARTERERAQADEIYIAGREIPIPPPRPQNPDALLPQQQNSANDHLARPCPHCAPNNTFDWTCPRPIPNPDTDHANAWNLENGPPPGHNYCGAWVHLNLTRRIDGPDFATVAGLIESDRIYDIFNNNSIEVDILFDYLREAEITPNMIYLDIIDHILATPEGFEPMIARDAFRGSHPVDMHVPDAQYTAARPREQLPSVLFSEFTDEEDSDDEREDERRRTGVSASGANGNSGRSANENSGEPVNEGSVDLANGEISPTTVLPRLADLMRTMRDTETPPSLTLPAVSRREQNSSMSPVLVPSFVAPISVPPLTSTSSINPPPPPSPPRRRRICRECATEVFLSGLKDWWSREMRTSIGKERLPVWVVSRRVCENGETCSEQINNDHAKACCHITGPVAGAGS
ncbi:Zinc finger, C3HC4 type (RING finger) protein [Rhizoctonia solani]|uniref:Zinc finger, C3HC4 type (RING finger) protein n=1 Tax=Rhizoctonia solani TaxID=456999 RepID=A0A8H8P8P0_9AGAM|nr:Zinc finger, C3HC4 type (RING finger) protein [Rhizoctonia solani]QRW27601.1 Zinc finger, C3HC4 type (RING finger) protein [Rhizoctonia solani]